jgi:PAS domain S-box-containing protein
MDLFQLISVLLVVLVLALAVVLFNMNKKIKQLREELNNTMGLIETRLALADKYAKTLAEVASKTFEAVIITDKNGAIEWVNAGFTTITGYTLAEVKGKKPGSVLQGPATDQQTVSRIREHLKEKKIFKEEILNYHKDGRSYWLSLSVTPVLDANNEVEKFIAIESDITEQKKQRMQLEQSLKEATAQQKAGV